MGPMNSGSGDRRRHSRRSRQTQRVRRAKKGGVGESRSIGAGMNRRLMTILLVAAVIAAAAPGLVYRLVSARISTSKPMSTTLVVAAAKDIPLGAVLTTADLTTMSLGARRPRARF